MGVTVIFNPSALCCPDATIDSIRQPKRDGTIRARLRGPLTEDVLAQLASKEWKRREIRDTLYDTRKYHNLSADLWLTKRQERGRPDVWRLKKVVKVHCDCASDHKPLHGYLHVEQWEAEQLKDLPTCSALQLSTEEHFPDNRLFPGNRLFAVICVDTVRYEKTVIREENACERVSESVEFAVDALDAEDHCDPMKSGVFMAASYCRDYVETQEGMMALKQASRDAAADLEVSNMVSLLSQTLHDASFWWCNKSTDSLHFKNNPDSLFHLANDWVQYGWDDDVNAK